MFTHSKEYKIDVESSSNNLVFEKCDERCLSSHWNYFCLQTLVSWKDLQFETCLRSLKCERIWIQNLFLRRKVCTGQIFCWKSRIWFMNFCSHEPICILNWVVFYIYFKMYYSIYKVIFKKQNLINGFFPCTNPLLFWIVWVIFSFYWIVFYFNLIYIKKNILIFNIAVLVK